MRKALLLVSSWLAVCALATAAETPASQTIFRVLAQLNQYSPPSGLTEVSPGLFYFPSGSGTINAAVLSITSQGVTTVLEPLTTGYYVQGPFVGGPNGQFYSSTWLGYTGQFPNPANVFSIGTTPNSGQTYGPQNLAPALTQNLPDSTLLGTAHDIFNDASSVVQSDLNGNVTPIYSFPSSDYALAAVYATDGNYYVAVARNRAIFIYRVTPSGSTTKIAAIDGGYFSGFTATLIQGSDGNLYGTTPLGGKHGQGSVYQLTLSGQHTLLYSFGKSPNRNPEGLIEGSDGNLYGSTIGYLSPTLLYRLSKSGKYTQIYQLPENHGCPCTLTQGSDGVIYGAAQGGFVFGLYGGLPKPVPSAQQFNPHSGPVGTQVLIWGHNVLAASVQFNGVAATQVSNSGANYVSATVPCRRNQRSDYRHHAGRD